MKNIDNTLLMLVVTLGCTARCAHCCLVAEPEKAYLQLGEEEMMQCIKEAHEAKIQGVVFTGGEPTIYLANLYKPIVLARALGLYTDIRTNAYWAKSKAKALEILKQLMDCGLQRLGLSCDSYHQQYVPQEYVINAIEATQILGMELYLDWIGFETMGDVTKQLKIDESVVRTITPPLRIGAAVELPSDYFDAIPVEEIECDTAFSQSCGSSESPLLTVFPGGYASYHQCCWVNPRLVYKIQGKHWLDNLKEQTSQDTATRFLKDYGVSGLIRKAKVESPEYLRDYYSHQCEVCFDLLSVLFPRDTELPWYLEELAKDIRPTKRMPLEILEVR